MDLPCVKRFLLLLYYKAIVERHIVTLRRTAAVDVYKARIVAQCSEEDNMWKTNDDRRCPAMCALQLYTLVVNVIYVTQDLRLETHDVNLPVYLVDLLGFVLKRLTFLRGHDLGVDDRVEGRVHAAYSQ